MKKINLEKYGFKKVPTGDNEPELYKVERVELEKALDMDLFRIYVSVPDGRIVTDKEFKLLPHYERVTLLHYMKSDDITDEQLKTLYEDCLALSTEYELLEAELSKSLRLPTREEFIIRYKQFADRRKVEYDEINSKVTLSQLFGLASDDQDEDLRTVKYLYLSFEQFAKYTEADIERIADKYVGTRASSTMFTSLETEACQAYAELKRLLNF